MLDFDRTLFLVDGMTEIKAFRSKFQKEYGINNVTIMKVDCNGRNVAPDGYANKACPLIRLALSRNCDVVVVVIDKETRKCSKKKFSKDIYDAILKRLVDDYRMCAVEVHIVVADIMFENWIVADVEGLKVRSIVRQSVEQSDFDGKNGCAILSKMLKVKYNKIIHGDLLFKAVNFNRALTNSSSFSNFFDVCFR